MNSPNQSTRTTQLAAVFLSKVAAATLLMMWGVVNLVFNFFSFLRLDPEARPESSEMTIGIVLTLIVGLLPFAFGVVWLWKLIGKKPEK